MLTQTPGVGQRYIAAYQDEDGAWLTGGNTYRLQVPANPPVEQFWSVTVYDEGTRQMIVNDTKSPDLSSRKADLDGIDSIATGRHRVSRSYFRWSAKEFGR